MTAVFSCEGLDVGYGAITVARDINVSVGEREVLAVLGPNGAGKTSTILTLAGLLTPLGGTIRLRGEAIKGGSARRLNRAGVVLVPDSRALFTAMTTRENLEIARRPHGMAIDEVFDTFPALATRAKVRAGMLSGGEQQMLALARALVQGPSVLIVDEMSMGLAPLIVEQLMVKLRAVADQTGAAVILVEQYVHLALEIADQAIVLVHGEVSLHGDAAGLRADPSRLESSYLGAEALEPHV
ncbi:MAG: ABC transporter ATP-binding protein [Ilumatobacteraceae bacterium]